MRGTGRRSGGEMGEVLKKALTNVQWKRDKKYQGRGDDAKERRRAICMRELYDDHNIDSSSCQKQNRT